MKDPEAVDILRQIHFKLDQIRKQLDKIEAKLLLEGLGHAGISTDEIPKGESPGE